MKKMLYMCAIEWKWIAQRPHFLEMELEKYYEITVLSPVHVLKKMKEQKNTRLPEHFDEFYLLPYQEKIGALKGISKSLFRNKVRDMNDYDIVWLGSSLFEKYIPEDYRGVVVFDYMDDCVSMQDDPRMKRAYELSHERLIKRADLIAVSSTYLMNMLPEEVRDKTLLVRNAFRGEVRIPPSNDTNTAESVSDGVKKIKIGYVGTIASWMDTELLKKSRREYPGIEYHFWGPVEGEEIAGDGFIYHGVVDHSAIPDAVKDMDALIMPFVVNDIVKAVDPVKLYEYISYGKNIISVRYAEVERFEAFAWLYDNETDYLNCIGRLCEGKLHCKYDEELQKAFLNRNTWEERAKDVFQALESIN